MIKCICVNDKNIPQDFKDKSKWVKKDSGYTIVRVLFISKSNTLGIELNEIDLSNCDTYLYFRANRFAIAEEDRGKLEELILACKDEQEWGEVNTEELIKQVEVAI